MVTINAHLEANKAMAEAIENWLATFVSVECDIKTCNCSAEYPWRSYENKKMPYQLEAKKAMAEAIENWLETVNIRLRTDYSYQPEELVARGQVLPLAEEI